MWPDAPLPLLPRLWALAQSSDSEAFWLLLGAHTALSLTVSLLLLGRLPRHLRLPRWASLLLLFNFSYIAPVIGPLVLVVVTRTSLRRARNAAQQARPSAVTVP